MHFLIVGAGLTGSAISRLLADEGHTCVILEQADHVAGNCHTVRDEKTGILIHQFGPHTLHTDTPEIWRFLERFVEIEPFSHRKQAWARGELYPFPINLTTINKLFDVDLTPEQAHGFIQQQVEKLDHEPRNFEEAALSTVGRKIYEAFYQDYTAKQWGQCPKDLPAFVFRRLPVHLSHKRDVFLHAQQGQPVGGYTHMVEQMLDHPNIELRLNTPFDGRFDRDTYDHLFYSGPIDRYFNWKHGRLAYRTLDFKHEYRQGTHQDCGSVNHCDADTPYTRVIEHKHFWTREQHDDTVISFEFSRACGPDDKPYYPIRLNEENKMYQRYVQLARSESNVSFVGRLGTYRYLDMDMAIGEAMQAAEQTIEACLTGSSIPTFFVDPATPTHTEKTRDTVEQEQSATT